MSRPQLITPTITFYSAFEPFLQERVISRSLRTVASERVDRFRIFGILLSETDSL